MKMSPMKLLRKIKKKLPETIEKAKASSDKSLSGTQAILEQKKENLQVNIGKSNFKEQKAQGEIYQSENDLKNIDPKKDTKQFDDTLGALKQAKDDLSVANKTTQESSNDLQSVASINPKRTEEAIEVLKQNNSSDITPTSEIQQVEGASEESKELEALVKKGEAQKKDVEKNVENLKAVTEEFVANDEGMKKEKEKADKKSEEDEERSTEAKTPASAAIPTGMEMGLGDGPKPPSNTESNK